MEILIFLFWVLSGAVPLSFWASELHESSPIHHPWFPLGAAVVVMSIIGGVLIPVTMAVVKYRKYRHGSRPHKNSKGDL